MEIIMFLVAVIQNFAISLGVGSSTLAVISFFVALVDGKIDETERKMMGIGYAILRIAMAIIFVSTALLLIPPIIQNGVLSLSPFTFGLLTAILVLFINAMLMTYHLMPSTMGPAIQAGSWYTLGVLNALEALNATNFTYVQFLLGTATMIALLVAIINGTMAYLKNVRERQTLAPVQ